jgi:hypothetical protein
VVCGRVGYKVEACEDTAHAIQVGRVEGKHAVLQIVQATMLRTPAGVLASSIVVSSMVVCHPTGMMLGWQQLLCGMLGSLKVSQVFLLARAVLCSPCRNDAG